MLLALPVLLSAPVARAQVTTTPNVTVTIANPDSLPRVDANGNRITKRQYATPEGISLQDCRDNLRIQFGLTLTGFGNSDNMEVWATDQTGADCTVPTARSGATQTCYRLDVPFGRLQFQTVDVPIKKLIVGLPGATIPSDGCRRVNSYTFTVYFLVLRGTDTAGSAKKSLVTDTQGPKALANVRVLPGDGSFTISWDSQGEGGADDITGAQAFCDPAPVPAGAADGGSTTTCTLADGAVSAVDASDDASVVDAGATCNTVANPATSAGAPIPTASGIPSDGTACTTQAFAPVGDEPLVPDSKLKSQYGCGDATGVTATTIRVDNVAGAAPVNGQVYAVAIAATDSFGNVGDLSAPLCQFPEATSDFWRDYRNAGGQSGGGCTVEGPSVPVGSLGLFLVGGVVVLSTLRRARRSQRRRNVR